MGRFFEEIWFDENSPIPESTTLVQVENNGVRLGFNHSLDLGIAGHVGATLAKLAASLSATASSRKNLQDLHTATTAEREAGAARLEKEWSATPMTAKRAMHELAAALPEDPIVVDESITALPEVQAAFDFANPDSYYAGRGGGIGQGIAGALGVQVARPESLVVAISGDGSAMYSSQALWTAAHHELPILFVILANREYRVLKHNLDIYRARFDNPSNEDYPHMNLEGPQMDFVALARSHGVDGRCVSDADDIASAVSEAVSQRRPFLLEIDIAGKQNQ